MATAKKVSELTALTNAAATDLLLVVHDPSANAESRKITVANFFGNVSANAIFNGTLSLSNTAAPATSTSTGRRGELRYDSNYLYVCVANNTWTRTAITTW